MYEIWRQRNPECGMYIDAKKLMNQKNYIMKHKKITEMEVEEIKRQLQESQRSHLEEREEEKQEHLGTTRDDGQKPEARSIYNRRRNGNSSTKGANLQIKKKIEITYYQVTQIATGKR